jgi:hypothetical protein
MVFLHQKKIYYVVISDSCRQVFTCHFSHEFSRFTKEFSDRRLVVLKEDFKFFLSGCLYKCLVVHTLPKFMLRAIFCITIFFVLILCIHGAKLLHNTFVLHHSCIIAVLFHFQVPTLHLQGYMDDIIITRCGGVTSVESVLEYSSLRSIALLCVSGWVKIASLFVQ